jgi:DDE superfamily endonuclease
LFIGHAARPRCFNKKFGKDLGFLYFHNQKAWMSGVIFKEYLIGLNNHVGRKVLLIIDNAPSHNIWEEMNLPNLDIEPLPPNTTSKLQLLDQGIISAFKQHFRRRQLSWALDQIDGGKHPFKVDQLTAMRWVNSAWNSSLPSTFHNCWKHSTLLDGHDLEPEPIQSDDPAITQEEYDYAMQQLNIRNPMSLENFSNPPEEETVLTHEIFTDEEILLMVEHVEQDDEQEAAEEEVPNPIANLSLEEQARALGKAAAILEMHDNVEWEKCITILRHAQRDMRWDSLKEKEARRIQRPITEFFFNRIS